MLFSSHHRRRPSVTWTARTIIRRAALQRSAVAYYSVTSRCSTVHDCLYAMPDAATPMLPAFFACRPCYVLLLRPRRGSAEYCDERVCLCVFVCLSAIISPKLYVRSSPICACFLWPWLGPALKLRISGFMNDVIFAHKLIGCSTSPPG